MTAPREAEAGGLHIPGQPRLCRETLSQKTEKQIVLSSGERLIMSFPSKSVDKWTSLPTGSHTFSQYVQCNFGVVIFLFCFFKWYCGFFYLVNRKSTKIGLALSDWAIHERQLPKLLPYRGGVSVASVHRAVRVTENEASELRAPHTVQSTLPLIPYLPTGTWQQNLCRLVPRNIPKCVLI